MFYRSKKSHTFLFIDPNYFITTWKGENLQGANCIFWKFEPIFTSNSLFTSLIFKRLTWELQNSDTLAHLIMATLHVDRCKSNMFQYVFKATISFFFPFLFFKLN